MLFCKKQKEIPQNYSSQDSLLKTVKKCRCFSWRSSRCIAKNSFLFNSADFQQQKSLKTKEKSSKQTKIKKMKLNSINLSVFIFFLSISESVLRKEGRKLQSTNTCTISGNITQIGKLLDQYQNTDAEVRK